MEVSGSQHESLVTIKEESFDDEFDMKVSHDLALEYT